MASFIYGIYSKKHDRIVYVGKVLCFSIERRSKLQFHDAFIKKKKSKLCSAIRKYGRDNFEYRIVEQCGDDDRVLSQREIHHIDRLNTYRNGYNMTYGGDTCSKRVACYNDAGELIATYGSINEAAGAINASASNISMAINGSKLKRVKRKWRFRLFQNQPSLSIEPYGDQKAKKICQLDVDGQVVFTYNSIAQAQHSLGITGISRCLKDNRGTAGGYRWRYA